MWPTLDNIVASFSLNAVLSGSVCKMCILVNLMVTRQYMESTDLATIRRRHTAINSAFEVQSELTRLSEDPKPCLLQLTLA